MSCFFAILVGYLLGSISPAYFFGRQQGLDIREHGQQYAGTLNVLQVVGKQAAAVTAIIDLGKGLLAVQLATLFGAQFHCAQLSGLAAIAGHVFPFYLDFRGGQGVACATGLLLSFLAHYLYAGALQLWHLAFLAMLILLLLMVTHHGEILSVFILPLLAYSILLNSEADKYNPYLLLIALYIVSVGIYNIVDRKLLVIREEQFRKKLWRILLRPWALLFVPIFAYHSRREALLFVAAVAAVVIFFDLRHNRKTRTGPSSISYFVLAVFLVFFLFPQKIAVTTLLLVIFPDMLAKIFGLAFGKRPLFGKTLEGSIAHLVAGFMCVYVLATGWGWAPFPLFLAAIAATITEALSLPPDDNLSVPALSGMTLVVLHWMGFVL